MGIEQLPDRLRAARTAVSLTQEQLGHAVGVTKSSVSAWENGRETPSTPLLPLLRKALRISLDELICGVGAPTVAPGMGYAVNEPAPPDWPATNIARNPTERALLQRLRGLSKARQNAVIELLGVHVDDAPLIHSVVHKPPAKLHKR